MQRADEARRLIGRIETVRLGECLRVDGDDGVDGWTALVVSVDAIEIVLDQLVRGELAGLEGRKDLVDRGLHDLERRRLGLSLGVTMRRVENPRSRDSDARNA